MVDYGPISISNTGNIEVDLLPQANAGKDHSNDVVRLKNILSRSDMPSEAQESKNTFYSRHIELNSSTERHAPKGLSNTMMLLKSATSILQSSAEIAASITLQVIPDILEGASLTIEKKHDEIYFDLYLSDQPTLGELVGNLDQITHDVAKFLNLRVRVRLFTTDGGQPQKSSFG